MSRILLVGKGPPAQDGIASFLTQLMTSLADRHDVRLVNLTRPGEGAGGRLTWSNLTRTVADTARVWREAGWADVVHVHSALAPHVTLIRAGLLGLAGRAHRAKVVIHAHGGLIKLWLTTPGRRRLARVALWPAHRVVAVSEGGREALAHALGGARVTLVDNGVDTAAFSGADPVHRPPRVVYAGVLTPRKGLLELFEASRRLTDSGLEHEVVVAGGAPPEGAEAEEAVRAAAPAAVRFVGQVPNRDMPALYRESDVFCLPSWWEAMPLSVLEAMAAGLPVVATSVGDVPRVVRNGETGLLVAAKDADALFEALERLLRRPELRRRLGAAGRVLVDRGFGASRVAEAMDGLYRELTASAPLPDAGSPVGAG